MPTVPIPTAPGLAGPVLADSSSGSGGGSAGTLVLIVVVLLFGGFLLYNGRRRAKAVQAQQEEIAIGSTIVTRSGMIATLIQRTEHYVVLQLDDGTRARHVPQAVARVWEEPVSTPDDGEPPAADGPLAD